MRGVLFLFHLEDEYAFQTHFSSSALFHLFQVAFTLVVREPL